MPDWCEQELTKQSPYAHTPVNLQENLIRVIYRPDHVDNNGRLLENAIPSQDLTGRGFSVQRQSYVKKEKIQGMIDNYVNKKAERSFHSLAKAPCKAVRALHDEQNNQIFCVIDDANEPEDAGHAIILCARPYPQSKLKKLRTQLLEVFSSLYSFEELFPSE